MLNSKEVVEMRNVNSYKEIYAYIKENYRGTKNKYYYPLPVKRFEAIGDKDVAMDSGISWSPSGTY